MSEKRKLSIGITVNLENYENLKVEVEGRVDGENDADELIAYLDSVLSRLGRADPDTKKRIDSYRRRVLESPEEHMKTEVHEESGYTAPETPSEKADVPVPPEPETAPAPAAGPLPEDKPAAEDTGFSCSSCGRSISKAEEQLSQIFMGRSLCKKCLEEMQK